MPLQRRERKNIEEETEEGSGSQGKNFPQLAFYKPTFPKPKNDPKPVCVHPDSPAHILKNQSIKYDNEGVGLFCQPFSSEWIFDCRATKTMTFDPHDLLFFGSTSRTHIQTASGENITIDSAGPIDITPSIHLQNCILFPTLSHKLLSITLLIKQLHCTVLLTSSACIVQDAQTGKIIGRGTKKGGLYYVNEAVNKVTLSLALVSPDQKLWIRHQRLGQPSLGYLKRLFPSLSTCTVSLDSETCVLAKSHKHSYLPSMSRTHKPFVMIHSDVWCPAHEFNKQGFSSFVLFVDDCTSMGWIYFPKHKSHVFDVFVKFYNMIVTQFQTNLSNSSF